VQKQYWVCKNEKLDINLVIDTEKLIEKFDTGLKINYMGLFIFVLKKVIILNL
jgi:hypothetical protein